MRRYLFLVWIFLFLFSSSVRADDTSLFTSPVPPNVLIILDSSNSFDEDFLGNAVGSYSPASKSVVGRNALISMISQFSNSIRAGLMTFQISGVSAYYIHNSPYFASYDPRSYCPNPPPEPGCVQYAKTGDLGARAACQTACVTGNPSFDPDYFPDEIISSYPPNDPRRDNYANLVYPKVQRMANLTDPSHYIYFKAAYPMYAPWPLGTAFCYAPNYDTSSIPDNGYSSYNYDCYTTKTGTSDGNPGYSGGEVYSGPFGPTDSDYANGYDNFGRRMPWKYVGQTWFSNSSPGGGYLQVPVGNLTDGNGNPTTTYNNLLSKLTIPHPNGDYQTGYMSCGNGDMNTCPYVINAGLTPTPGTFQTAINYFSGVKGYTSPIQAWCQKNFVVFVTDGLPDTDVNGNPGTAASLMPAVLAKIDALRNMTIGTTFDIPTYVLGVGSDITNITNLDQMAVHGGTDLNGHSYYANNPQQFMSALQSVFNDIMERSYSFTSPTVPTVRMIDNNILYISAFTPNATPFWPGTLKAYQLNSDGTLPVDTNGNPFNPPIWGASIPASGSRVIKTYTPGAGFVDFNSSNLTPADLGVATIQQRDQIISYVRNLQLGDIFHSNSVIVGPPSQYFQDTGYSGPGGFYQTNKNRTKVIIAGANDGMLHAFDAATGVEVWAFIPNSVLQNLIIMQTAHTYYVDGSPTAADVWFYNSPTDTTKSEDKWRTVLVCGLRKGGNTFFALDITDTLNPKYLWQFPNSNDAATLSLIGQSWSEPAIGRVRIEGSDGNLYERWVAFVGGGYDPTGKGGKAFFVIDIETGGIIWQFLYNSNDSQMKWMTYPLAAPPTAVDTNSDGYVDKVYIGDLGGQMWVFNVSFNALTNKSNSLWTGQRLFTAPVGPNEQHKIYYQPAVSSDNSGNPWVYFGTGDIQNPLSSTNPPERFYAVKDDGLGNYPRTEANLEMTNGNTFIPSKDPLKGWYIQLQKSGNSLEKVLSKPSIYYHLVYFTTYTYTPSADLCSTTSASKLYAVDYLSGGGALNVDSLSQLSGTPSQMSEQIGSGVPSSPVISINTQAQGTVIIGTTSNQIFSHSTFSPKSNKTIIYWRDLTR